MTHLHKLFIAAILAGTPVYSEVVPSFKERMSIEEPGRKDMGCFADLRIADRVGGYNRAETHQTSMGPVVAQYTTEGGQGEPDFVEILATPEGTIAVPRRLQLESGDQNLICLMKWIGS